MTMQTVRSHYDPPHREDPVEHRAWSASITAEVARQDPGISDLAVALGIERWLATKAVRDAVTVLRDAGVTARAPKAIEWLPALEVGWVNGLCDAERRRLLLIVDESAVGRDDRAQVAQWCHAAPDPQVSAAGRAVLRHRLAALPPASAQAALDCMMDACYAVADAAGGLGLWRISAHERQLAETIRGELTAARVSPPLVDGGATPAAELYVRMLAEYRETPGLSLTVAQASQLLRVEPDTCERILRMLAELGQLQRSADGRYCAPGSLDSGRRRATARDRVPAATDIAQPFRREPS